MYPGALFVSLAATVFSLYVLYLVYLDWKLHNTSLPKRWLQKVQRKWKKVSAKKDDGLLTRLANMLSDWEDAYYDEKKRQIEEDALERKVEQKMKYDRIRQKYAL
ncbi:hypothetical protein EMCRGX_G013021 [Ephydatia muelleri]